MALTPEQQRKLEANLAAQRAFVQPGYGGNPAMGQRFASVSPAESFRNRFPGLGFFPSQEAAAIEQLRFAEGMSPFGGFVASLPALGAQLFSSAPQLPGDLINRALLPADAFAAANAPRDAAFAKARSARPVNAPDIAVTAQPGMSPDAAVPDPFAAFMQGGAAPTPIQTVTTTSGSPEALAMGRMAASFAQQAAQDRERKFTVQGAPIPEVPKLQKTDFSGMDAAVAMLKPEEFAEDVERKKLALPYLMAGIAQGGFSASEDAGIGTILFKMGLGALGSKALVDEEVNRRRDVYEGRMREYARALANGEQAKAQTAAQEANNEIMMAYEREVNLSNIQQPQLGADGSLTQRTIDPKTGETKVTIFTPGDAARAAGLMGQAAGIVLGATPRTSVSTQTGGGGGSGLPEFAKDEIVRRMRIASGEPTARILASDVVKYNLFGSLGLDEEDLQQIDQEALRIATSNAGPGASPSATTEAYQNARLNVIASLIDQNAGNRVVSALRSQGLSPGASYVKVN